MENGLTRRKYRCELRGYKGMGVNNQIPPEILECEYDDEFYRDIMSLDNHIHDEIDNLLFLVNFMDDLEVKNKKRYIANLNKI